MLVVMTAAGSENPPHPAAMALSPPTEMAALSLSSMGLGVSVVMAATGSENPRDSAVRASSPPNGTVLTLSSETMGVPAAVASADGATSLLTDAVLSLSLETMGVPAAVASADGATSLLTDAVLLLSSETGVFQQWPQPMGPPHC